MDTDGIRVRPAYTNDSEDAHHPQPGAWPHSHQESRQQARAQPADNHTDPPPGAQQQQRRRHWKARKCRICFDVVQPTFVPPPENVPRMFQPRPQVIYESEDGGRLLRPCKCKGSNKYVHEGCLQRWRLQDPTSKRNYWSCPTCKFDYRLSRLGWGQLIGRKVTQVILTLSIFVVAVFLLGFIADPIIDLYNHPWGTTFGFFGGGGYYRDSYLSRVDYPDEKPGWGEHFLKGFAGLGLLSMIKGILSSPLYYFRFGGGGGRRTGRDRMNEISWIVVLIGVATFLYATWKLVAAWSARFLQRVGERVMDVQADDDDEDDDDGEDE